MENIEVELKFPLLNAPEFIKRLNLIAQPVKEEDYQKDIYYIPVHRNFLDKTPVSEWLRLRESNKGTSLNYKKWHNGDGNKTVSCDEFETKIENIEALKRIFENLNFKDIIIVEKIRNIWIYKNTEIAIDKVKELGDFIEIEAKGNFADIEEAKKYIYEALRELGAEIGGQDFEGYPYKLLKIKKICKKFLTPL